MIPSNLAWRKGKELLCRPILIERSGEVDGLEEISGAQSLQDVLSVDIQTHMLVTCTDTEGVG